jgi:hypothetical protein
MKGRNVAAATKANVAAAIFVFDKGMLEIMYSRTF